ncbi:biotin--[acetyl-CoA-carboxylase] ligase [Sphingomonas gellani]|uniref:biotin--[acetyl-CoA-carboxylase] ligase n=1 Tax=Sphingomonas gellani TaxID=1166340 RepID=UPI000B82EEA1|nr:biotin--[acetyl-CoA-carboxylase] ligase [Sphingomonas gellani]
MIRTVAETGSTNADLLVLAVDGAVDEGVWLRAERQHAGRGREGRNWLSPAGNLYVSTVVRMRPTDPAASGLALIAAVALDDAVGVFLDRSGSTVQRWLKWPNDLLIDGAKLSGILLERQGPAVVVGFGVNLHHHPDLAGRRTTSLTAVGVPVEPDVFLEVLGDSFARWLQRWRVEGLGAVRQRWLARAHPIGTGLTVRSPDGEVLDGLFDGLADDGALLLRLASGERRVIHAGDVFHL